MKKYFKSRQEALKVCKERQQRNPAIKVWKFDIKQRGIAELLDLLNAHGVEKYTLNEVEQAQEPCALADNIKAVMAEHGITQRELAKKLGTHPVVVNNTIHNPNVKVSTLKRYADAIGCTVGDFFNR